MPTEPTRSLREGFSGLGVPEADGGMGGSLVDCAIVAEQLGRTVVPTPFLSHLVAVHVAHAAGLDVAAAATGETVWSLASDEQGRPFDIWATTAADGRIFGSKSAVRDAGTADAFVVTCADGRVAVATAERTTPREGMDRTRPVSDVEFDGPQSQVVAGVSHPLDPAQTILAAGLVGVGQGAVELAAAFARERRQFGQPVGRFQGLAHQLADARANLEIAWNLVLYASWALSAGVPDAATIAHAAKARAGEAAVYAAERTVQAHGGIGVTAEADPHLFLRRAVADSMWLGTSRAHKAMAGSRALSAAAMEVAAGTETGVMPSPDRGN